MTHQSEAQLERSLVERLVRLAFEPVNLEDAGAFEANLRSQLEKFNQITFSDGGKMGIGTIYY